MRSLHFFKPILAGASLRERLLACIGAMIGIGLTGWISTLCLGIDPNIPLIVAPVGASAVLVFAVPASPLAQPWSVIGGNVISGLVGITVAYMVEPPFVAAGVAVALAIAIMSFGRCLHPPGGAVALMTALGGPAIAEIGYLYAFVPIALNSAILVALGVVFHRLSRRQYPHRPAAVPLNPRQTNDPAPQLRLGFNADDISAALQAVDETFDIHPDDLTRLLWQVEKQSLLRQHGEILVSQIMSRDVIKSTANQSVTEARDLLLRYNVRALPVVDDEGKLLGIVGLRELVLASSGKASDYIIPAVSAPMQAAAMSLVPLLSDGVAHAVIITDDNNHVVGIVSQTDLLNALARTLRHQPSPRKKSALGLQLLRRAS